MRRGVSSFSGDSSMSAGAMRSGSTPIWRSSSSLRGLALASTSWERPPMPGGLLETVGDAALGQVIGRHLDQHLVACQDADAVLAHLARGVGDDLVIVL